MPSHNLDNYLFLRYKKRMKDKQILVYSRRKKENIETKYIETFIVIAGQSVPIPRHSQSLRMQSW